MAERGVLRMSHLGDTYELVYVFTTAHGINYAVRQVPDLGHLAQLLATLGITEARLQQLCTALHHHHVGTLALVLSETQLQTAFPPICSRRDRRARHPQPPRGRPRQARGREDAMDAEMGEAAGQIWHSLRPHGATTLRQLQHGTTLSERLVLMGRGWLAREGQLRSVPTRRGLTYALHGAQDP